MVTFVAVRRGVRKHRKALSIFFAVSGVLSLVDLAKMPQTRLTDTLFMRGFVNARFDWLVPMAVLWLVGTIAINLLLESLNKRWLEWSLGHFKGNFAFRLLSRRWLWIPYSFLLVVCIPFIVFLEELVFRQGTTNWHRGLLLGALVFGMLHILMGYNIRASISASISGAFLVYVYMHQGFIAVFMLHTVYDLIVVLLLVADFHLKGPLTRNMQNLRRATNQLNES
jgi:membrane protease YdiL (CAAX protease family)